MSLLSAADPAASVLLGGGAVLLLLLLLLLCLLGWLSTRPPPGLPPGPGPALPLLGHLHLLGKDPRPQLQAWRRQHGEVFSLRLGGQLAVVLGSYSAMREALVTMAHVFSDRPKTFVVDTIVKGKGIGSASGLIWKEQRKTGLEILRQMGMGKNLLAEKIQEEITHYIRAIRDHQGAPAVLGRLTQMSISNNICSITLGQRFQYDDSAFNHYIQCIDTNFKLMGGTGILNFLPILRFIPGDPFQIKTLMANTDSIYGFVSKHIGEHKKTLAEEKGEMAENTDFIYNYLHQIHKQTIRGNESTTMDEENLRAGVTDLFVAGTETTSSALQWALVFFLHHPHVQDRCHQELSEALGAHRPPSMADKPNLPYLEATICEVLRKGDIVPLSVSHTPAHDVTFRGYVIPKGTVIIPYISHVLQDPEIWGDPENFRPERFLGPDGKLTRHEEFIPFGMGRRVCLGESLARMELFLYLATLVQHFHFRPAEEGQLPPLEGVFGLTHPPKPYQIRAVPRM